MYMDRCTFTCIIMYCKSYMYIIDMYMSCKTYIIHMYMQINFVC